MPENNVQQDPRCQLFVSDPYSLYAQWHDAALPVYWEDYGFWCLLDFDTVSATLRDRRFARLPPPGTIPAPSPSHMQNFAAAEKFSLLAMEPPDHTRLRKLVNRSFISRQLNRMVPVIDALAHACIDGFEQDQSVDLLPHYATPVAIKLITRLLGVPESAGEQLVAWSHAMVRVYTLTQTHEEEIRADKAAAQFQTFLKGVLEEKEKQPGNDLLSHMLALRGEAQPLSIDEIICVTILLLNAGHEATVHQLGNSVFTLLKHYPDDKRELLLTALADDQSADAIVGECLRYAPPLHLFTRYAQEDVTLKGGLKLASGDQVGLLLAAANRCPEKFAQPNRFIPDRDDAAHLSLGAGIHYCVGAHLARMELRIALQVLFQRLPDLKLARTPEYQDTFHFHGLDKLEVCW